MDAEEVKRAIELDPAWTAELKQRWLELMELAVFGDLKSSRLGALGKLRRRALELGEKLRSFCSDRDWIPHPREQVKNALASSLNLKDSLLQLVRAAQEVDGGSALAAFNEQVMGLHGCLVGRLEELESRWAALLDSQYAEQDDKD